MARSGGMKRWALAELERMRADASEFQDFYDALAQTGELPPETGGASSKLTVEMILAYAGNIAELLDQAQLVDLGQAVVREYELDNEGRSEWLEVARAAQKTAAQKKPEKKTYPYENAANVKYPLLTTSCIQFAARAYPAIVRGDEVIDAKPLGEDGQGLKAKRAARSAAFANDQLIYRCTEWETGTDALLHALPAIGAAFRKVYWDAGLKRPRLDYVSAIDVVIPFDAPNLDLTPRITHEIDKYPFEIEKLVRDGTWLQCDYNADSSDTQKKVRYLEQVRYADLDDDGLSEPYIVTVHKDSGTVVRIDPAYDVDDVEVQPYIDTDGSLQASILSITRQHPWIDYCFIPNPEGGAYGIGFGQLIASISDVIDTTINELLDAGHLANTNTGFISSMVKTRSGELEMKLNAFKQLPGAQNVKEAIYRLEFPGPNQTLFNLLEFLIEAAKDITSIKDVLTGDAPGTQPATSTLALIEQGLQVFSAIYKRIYRAMTREFELLYRLNARYLDEETYNRFLDSQPPEAEIGEPSPMLGHNGGPPLSPQDMGAPLDLQAPASPQPPQPMGEVVPFPSPLQNGAGLNGPTGAGPQFDPAGMAAGPDPTLATPPGGAPQPGQAPFPPSAPPQGLQAALAGQLQAGAPQARPTPAEDFNLDDMDIRPVADPTAVTEMQRLAKANFLGQFKGDPTVNQVEINKRMFEAARLPEPDKLIAGPDPLMQLQAQAQAAMLQSQAEAAKWDATLKQHQATAAQLEPQFRQREVELAEAQAEAAKGELPLREREVAAQEAQANATMQLSQVQVVNENKRLANEEHRLALEEAERGERLEMDRVKGGAEVAEKAERLDLDRTKHRDESEREAILGQLKVMTAQAQADKAALEVARKQLENEKAEIERDKAKTEAELPKKTLEAQEKANKHREAQAERESKYLEAQEKALKQMLTEIQQMAKALEDSRKPKSVKLVRDRAGKVAGFIDGQGRKHKVTRDKAGKVVGAEPDGDD